MLLFNIIAIYNKENAKSIIKHIYNTWYKTILYLTRVNNQYSDKPIFRQLLLLNCISYELLVYSKIYLLSMSSCSKTIVAFCMLAVVATMQNIQVSENRSIRTNFPNVGPLVTIRKRKAELFQKNLTMVI